MIWIPVIALVAWCFFFIIREDKAERAHRHEVEWNAYIDRALAITATDENVVVDLFRQQLDERRWP